MSASPETLDVLVGLTARVRDADLLPIAVSPAADELLATIVATPRARGHDHGEPLRRRGVAIAGIAAGVAACGAALLLLALPGTDRSSRFWQELHPTVSATEGIAVHDLADLEAAADAIVVGIVVDVIDGPPGIPVLDEHGTRISVLDDPAAGASPRLVVEVQRVIGQHDDAGRIAAGARIAVDLPPVTIGGSASSSPALFFLDRERGWEGTPWDGAYVPVHSLGILTDIGQNLFGPLAANPDAVEPLVGASTIADVEDRLQH